MKRILKTLLPVIAVVFLFSACDPPMRTASGPAGPSIDLFAGSWTLSAVTFSNLADGAVQTAFDEAPPKDFVNSKWQLNKDGKGSYTLVSGTTQTIFWSVNGGDALGSQFHFKKVNAGQNPEDVTNGYQLVISANTGTAMTLKALVYTGNKNGYVVYTFDKAK